MNGPPPPPLPPFLRNPYTSCLTPAAPLPCRRLTVRPPSSLIGPSQPLAPRSRSARLRLRNTIFGFFGGVIKTIPQVLQILFEQRVHNVMDFEKKEKNNQKRWE